MNWKTVKRYQTFEEADKRRNELIKEGVKAKVRKYVNRGGTRFEVKVPKEEKKNERKS